MPYGFSRDFTAYAAKRPELSRWLLRAEKDNGIIGAITAEPAEKPSA
jgi:hypothetical protein